MPPTSPESPRKASSRRIALTAAERARFMDRFPAKHKTNHRKQRKHES